MQFQAFSKYEKKKKSLFNWKKQSTQPQCRAEQSLKKKQCRAEQKFTTTTSIATLIINTHTTSDIKGKEKKNSPCYRVQTKITAKELRLECTEHSSRTRSSETLFDHWKLPNSDYSLPCLNSETLYPIPFCIHRKQACSVLAWFVSEGYLCRIPNGEASVSNNPVSTHCSFRLSVSMRRRRKACSTERNRVHNHNAEQNNL